MYMQTADNLLTILALLLALYQCSIQTISTLAHARCAPAKVIHIANLGLVGGDSMTWTQELATLAPRCCLHGVSAQQAQQDQRFDCGEHGLKDQEPTHCVCRLQSTTSREPRLHALGLAYAAALSHGHCHCIIFKV